MICSAAHSALTYMVHTGLSIAFCSGLDRKTLTLSVEHGEVCRNAELEGCEVWSHGWEEEAAGH